jgi:hypothetical protein
VGEGCWLVLPARTEQKSGLGSLFAASVVIHMCWLLLLTCLGLVTPYLLRSRHFETCSYRTTALFAVHASDGRPRLHRATSCRITPETTIFCNRELNINTISAVGFDMDYTLARYKPEFELLAYTGAKDKLVRSLGYPEEVMDLKYHEDISRRGCMIDRKRGNILKLDQHRYVRAVEHGLTPLTREQRKGVYRASYQETETFTGKEFINIDTPFSLVDACLYAQLVDMKDRCSKRSLAALPLAADATDTASGYETNQVTHQLSPTGILGGKSYSELWQDLRRCVERCHHDGTIKLKVAEDPAKYIVHDEQRKHGEQAPVYPNAWLNAVSLNYYDSVPYSGISAQLRKQVVLAHQLALRLHPGGDELSAGTEICPFRARQRVDGLLRPDHRGRKQASFPAR